VRSSVRLLPPRRAKSIEAAKEENDQGAINDGIIDLSGLIPSGRFFQSASKLFIRLSNLRPSFQEIDF
jgi:hypothetical protein